MATNTNINFPQSEFLDPRTQRPAREWMLWLMSPSVISVNFANALGVTSGGTGLSTIPTNGQLLIGNGTGYTLDTLTPGTGIGVTNGVGSIAVANTGVLSWSGGVTGLTPAAVTTGNVTLSGVLGAGYGGTGLSSYAIGDMIYASGTAALARLAAGTAGKLLTSAGAAAPVWAALDLSSPPAIGGTTPAAGTFTTLIATGQTSLGGVTNSESFRVLTPVAAAGLRLQVGVPNSTVVRLGPAGSAIADFRILAPTFTNFYTGSSSDGLSDGSAQMRITHTASAVNYVQVTGSATGGQPNITAQGSDAAIGLTYRTKGNFNHQFQNGSIQICFEVAPVASTANYVRATSAIATASPILSAQGTDTNIDLALTPKGTGNVRFGTYTGTILTPTGYVEVKDSGGTVRRLLVG